MFQYVYLYESITQLFVSENWTHLAKPLLNAASYLICQKSFNFHFLWNQYGMCSYRVLCMSVSQSEQRSVSNEIPFVPSNVSLSVFSTTKLSSSFLFWRLGLIENYRWDLTNISIWHLFIQWSFSSHLVVTQYLLSDHLVVTQWSLSCH